jgi:hypothetical protein
MKANRSAIKAIFLVGLGATSFLTGLASWNEPFAPAPAAAQLGPELCARCRGSRRDGPDNRCEGSRFGGDYCAGRCDELRLCTCREIGDCDGDSGGLPF